MPKLTKEQNDMRVSDHVQSILVDRNLYSIGDACSIVKALGFNCFYVDPTDNYWRIRQFNPELRKNPRYKFIDSNKLTGVRFLIQY